MDAALAKLYADHFTTLRARHQAALSQEGFDRVVIFSGYPRTLFLDDRTSPFVANPQFRCWVPLPRHEGGAVVAAADGDVRLLFFRPQDYWHATPAAPAAQWSHHYDLREVATAGQLSKQIRSLGGRVALIGDDTVPEELVSSCELNPAGLINRLHYARAEKTGYEIECLRRANAIAVTGHRAAERAFREHASEFDIHLEYCRACGQDANELPYDNIVALNEHAAVLHYTRREHRRGEHRSFLIDAGASYNGYASDITRTYSHADDDFTALISAMDDLQQSICADVTIGREFVELNATTHQRLAAVLCEHGIVTCSPEACLAGGVTRTFFPHGLGHYIGTQVHDVGGHQASAEGGVLAPPDEYPFLRLTRKLTEGAVCTVEPGLYFIDMLLQQLRESSARNDVDWNRVEHLKPYGGIRIEDDVLVTGSTPDNLTRSKFAA